MAPSSTIHPAFSVGNIHTHVKTTLTLQDTEYRTWRHVFNVHCGSYGVQGHLTGKSTPTGPDDEQWQRLDCLVLSWIYATISPELLTMIIDPDATAHTTWKAIEKLFLDNKKARALALMEEYNSCVKGDSSITDYCNRLKKLSDQLKDVDHTISNEDLVLKCLRGLPPTYQALYNIIPLQTPFPDFLKVRSMLLLEENRQNLQDSTNTTTPTTALYTSSSQSITSNNNKGGKGKQQWKTKGNNNYKNKNNQNNQPTQNRLPTYTYPCIPYPPAYPYYSAWNPNAGILGPRPQTTLNPRPPCPRPNQTFFAAGQTAPVYGQIAPSWPQQPMDATALIP